MLKSQELINSENVLLTCDDDNIGSYKIKEKNSGKLENVVENEDEGEIFMTRRYWISLKKKLEILPNYESIPYRDEDYEFVREVKKNAYIKYVEACWGLG